MASLSHKDLLGIEQLSVDDINLILIRPRHWGSIIPAVGFPHCGKTVINLFFGPPQNPIIFRWQRSD
jgi:hypothetical protein